MDRIPGEPGTAHRRPVRNHSVTESTNNGRNLDWEIEVGLGQIVS